MTCVKNSKGYLDFFFCNITKIQGKYSILSGGDSSGWQTQNLVRDFGIIHWGSLRAVPGGGRGAFPVDYLCCE